MEFIFILVAVVVGAPILFAIYVASKISRQAEEIKSLRSLMEALQKDLRDLERRFNAPARTSQPKPETFQKTTITKEETKEIPGPVSSREEDLKPRRPPPPVPLYVPPVDVPEVPEKLQSPYSKPGFDEKVRTAIRDMNWENFLGAKMFAWVGGLSLFIGFAFLLKYSFDRDLISPAVRVAMGFVAGAGLIAGGMHLKRKTFVITAQTLCATGVVILYASTFAGAQFGFYGPTLAFLFMSAITAGAFVLAAGTSAMVVAILGLVGGFLTPPLLSTGVDRPFALFSYITFLNIGLLSVAFYRRWDFLAVLGAIGTVLMQIGWAMKFFVPEKVFIAMAIFLWFDALFLAAFWYARKTGRLNRWLIGSTAAFQFVTFIFTFFLISEPVIAMRPGVLFSFLLGADLCLLAIVFLKCELQKIHLAAGGSVFFVLSAWTASRLTSELLPWALGGSLVFAILHSAIPMFLARIAPSSKPSWQPHVFPLLALFMTLLPIVKELGSSWLLWPFVLLINAIILALAFLTASTLAILAAVAVTAIVMLGWIFSEPAGAFDLVELLVIVGAFGVVFSIGSTFVLGRVREKLSGSGGETGEGSAGLWDSLNSNNLFLQIPVFSSVLPFLLLIIAAGRIEIANPASIFGLGLFLSAIAIGLVRYLKEPLLLPITMACNLALLALVHSRHFNIDNAAVFLAFNVVFLAIFSGLPFLFKTDYRETATPWANAALSGPLHFLLIYDVMRKAYPNDFMGVLPAVMAVPFFFGLVKLIEWIPKDFEKRNTILAWFGGVTLFFITLVFPIQFDREWLTVGWALEGVALIWLFHKIPHPGLRGVGVALLIITFIRLALNPAVLSYHERSSTPILNWFLYVYGIAIVCLMIAGRLLAPPRNEVMNTNVPPILYSLGTILAFLLMNIEIADVFSDGRTLTFQFSGDLARGMTYSIAWALFALGLLVIGIWKRLRPVRLSAMGLIGVTLVKLFFFDLSQLDQLYRIGAFIGVAIVLIIASALYQKWIVRNS